MSSLTSKTKGSHTPTQEHPVSKVILPFINIKINKNPAKAGLDVQRYSDWC